MESYSSLICRAAVAAILLFGLSAIGVAQTTESGDDQYRRILKQSTLSSDSNAEVLVREHTYPPGWQAPTHFHDGDLFIYVVDGEFEATTDEAGRVLYISGEAMQMKADTTMDARNASDTEPLKLVIFQVGELGTPFLVEVE